MRKKILMIFLTVLLAVAFATPTPAKVINLKFANFFPPPSFQSKYLQEFL